MNRTDRLLAIVLELQGGGRRTAEALARTFEVSKRTIYRDIAALNETGVPVVSSPGQGYWLMEGYFLPPVQFSSDEATLLLLGAEVMAHSFDTEYRRVAEAAGRKIEGVLSATLRAEVDYLRDNIRFLELDDPSRGAIRASLQRMRRAVMSKQTVTFRYYKRHDGSESVRTVDPHNMFHMNGIWLMSGFCHSRRALRTFRLNRMEALQLVDRRFERRAPVQSLPATEDRNLVVVVVRFTPEASRWLPETPSYFMTDETPTPEGLLVTLKARRAEEVLPWLQSWGGAVTVLEPASLRQRLFEEAAQLAGRYREAMLT